MNGPRRVAILRHHGGARCFSAARASIRDAPRARSAGIPSRPRPRGKSGSPYVVTTTRTAESVSVAFCVGRMLVTESAGRPPHRLRAARLSPPVSGLPGSSARAGRAARPSRSIRHSRRTVNYWSMPNARQPEQHGGARGVCEATARVLMSGPSITAASWTRARPFRQPAVFGRTERCSSRGRAIDRRGRMQAQRLDGAARQDRRINPDDRSKTTVRRQDGVRRNLVVGTERAGPAINPERRLWEAETARAAAKRSTSAQGRIRLPRSPTDRYMAGRFPRITAKEGMEQPALLLDPVIDRRHGVLHRRTVSRVKAASSSRPRDEIWCG